jgi:hypothetical protein
MTNKKNIIKNFSLIIILFILIVPFFVHAQIIPCTNDCGYQDLLQLVTNIINWIIMVSIPVCAGVFAWAGFQYMTSSVVDKKAAAKEMIRKVFIGFVFVLSAYLIVDTILKALT